MSADVWKHANKEWQKVLDLAHKLGWPDPIKARDHVDLILCCPGSGEDQCNKIKIYSTGRGAESVAKSALRKVKQCPHGNQQDILVKVERALEAAERLISAVELRIERHEIQEEFNELLELTADSLKCADEYLSELVQKDATVFEAISRSLTKSEMATSSAELIEESRKDLRTVKLALRDDLPHRFPTYGALETHRAQLVDRMDEARSVVATLQEFL